MLHSPPFSGTGNGRHLEWAEETIKPPPLGRLWLKGQPPWHCRVSWGPGCVWNLPELMAGVSTWETRPCSQQLPGSGRCRSPPVCESACISGRKGLGPARQGPGSAPCCRAVPCGPGEGGHLPCQPWQGPGHLRRRTASSCPNLFPTELGRHLQPWADYRGLHRDRPEGQTAERPHAACRGSPPEGPTSHVHCEAGA